MHISRLVARNFRNFRAATFRFNSKVNTLVGENASGKTNALYAIRLLIDTGLPLRARFLEESDFSRALPDGWRGHWIVLSAEFDDLDPAESSQVLSCQGLGHLPEDEDEDDDDDDDDDDDSSGTTGTYSLFFRPKLHARAELHRLSKLAGRKAKCRAYLEKLTLEDYETQIRCRTHADFSDDSTYRKHVGDFEACRFPDPDKEDLHAVGVLQPVTFSLAQEFTCTFVHALRNVVSDLRNLRRNPLAVVLKTAHEEIDPATATALVDDVKALNEKIEDINEVKSVATSLRQTLREAVGFTYAPDVSVKSELPEQADDLLKSLALWVGDAEDDYQGRVDELSLGGANIIYLSLKLLEFTYKRRDENAAHFLLVEEPEAHIHTHVQKTLFHGFAAKSTQIIVTTHSTHISDVSKISAVNVLSREARETDVQQPGNGLETKVLRQIERYLDAVRSTLLFAKGVVLVEGDAELIAIPAMLRAAFGVSLDELGVSLINMSSTVFSHVAVLFHQERIRRRCAIITDLDAALDELPDDKKDDDAEQRRQRKSQESGAQRKEALDEFSAGNELVEVFYAKHTFEIDFRHAGNRSALIRTIPALWTQEAAKKRHAKLVKSTDRRVAGKAALTLAEKAGKGWFALLLADSFADERVTPKVEIPSYIRDAIAFAAAEQISDELAASMARYRLDLLKDSISLPPELETRPEDDTSSDLVSDYCSHLPTDQLAKFLEKRLAL